MEGDTSEGHKNNLSGNNDANDKEEQGVAHDSFKDILLIVDLSRVQEIEHLHHDEHVEDCSEVSRIHIISVFHWFVYFINTVDIHKTSLDDMSHSSIRVLDSPQFTG